MTQPERNAAQRPAVQNRPTNDGTGRGDTRERGCSTAGLGTKWVQDELQAWGCWVGRGLKAHRATSPAAGRAGNKIYIGHGGLGDRKRLPQV